MSSSDQSSGSWTLLTGHGHVLVEIARDPDSRIRDISDAVGLTERTVQAIVTDLETAGYITRSRTGRRTRYTVQHDTSFRHPAQEGLRVGPFLAMLAADENQPPRRGRVRDERGLPDGSSGGRGRCRELKC
jgi:MarR family